MSAKLKVLITIIFMDLLAGMEFDLFVPSFPELKNQFHLSPSLVEALLSVNFLGYCLSLFVVGWLSDRYGRKPIILSGLTMFVIGSVVCLWPQSYAFLLIGRFLQGVGVAAPAILSFLIIADTYALKQQQYFIAMLNGAMNISVACSPVIGSYITLYFHWQGNFTALLLLGLLVLAMTAIFVPTTKLPKHPETTSVQGYISLLKSKPLMLLITYIVLMCIPYWIFVGMSPLLYIKSLGVSLSHFGYYQGSMALVFAFGSIVFGFMLNKYKQKKALHCSTFIFIAAFIGIALVTAFDTHNPLWITLVMIIFCVGQIIPSTILYPFALNFVPHAKGRVSAIMNSGKLIFSAAGLQLAAYYYRGTFQNLGIILAVIVLLVIILQFLVVEHRELQSS